MPDPLTRLHAALAQRYTVLRELGHGGMAMVYLAEDLKHHRAVAIKVLRAELAAAIGPERFLREIEISARLRHPHILPVYDSGETDAFLYYVMPYVEGESLRDRLNRERQLPLDDALQIAREVADALSYAHSHGIVHRDIKPENILLESGHAVVADFGIARAIDAAGGDRLTETGLAVGTPAYMSPEQASGERELDGRTDVYSLGCVLYEMLTGTPPHTGSTAQAVLARKLAEPAPPLRTVRETVPTVVERAVMTALARVPADRFTSAQRMAEALTTGGPVAGIRPGMSRRTTFGLVVVLVLLAGLTATLLKGNRTVPLEPRRVLVIPLLNRTGDAALDELGRIAADWITLGLAHEGVVDVVPTSSVLQALQALDPNVDQPMQPLARLTSAGTAISGAYYRQADTVRFRVEVVDVQGGKLLYALEPVSGPTVAPLDAIEKLRQRVVRTVLRHFSEPVPENRVHEGPQSLWCPSLVYPDSLRRAAIEGTVLISFVVDATGVVEPHSIRVIASDHAGFEQATRSVVSACRYRPGRVDGEPVRTAVSQSFAFRIKRPPPIR